jgi:hypothetical protein
VKLTSLKYNCSVAASLNVLVVPSARFQSAVHPKMMLLSPVVVIVTDGADCETAVPKAPPNVDSAFKTT